MSHFPLLCPTQYILIVYTLYSMLCFFSVASLHNLWKIQKYCPLTMKHTVCNSCILIQV